MEARGGVAHLRLVGPRRERGQPGGRAQSEALERPLEGCRGGRAASVAAGRAPGLLVLKVHLPVATFSVRLRPMAAC